MTEDAFFEHDLWALVRPDGTVVEVVRGDASRALHAGSRHGDVVLDAEGSREEAYRQTELVANPGEKVSLPTVRESPRRALDAAQLPRISLRNLFRRYPLDRRGTPWGDGLVKAHEEIRGFFPTFKREQRVERWQDPTRTVEELLATTEKMKKPVPLPDGTLLPVYAFGLMLAPNYLAFQSGIGVRGTVCLWSTPQCRASCLVYNGRNEVDPYNRTVKIAKTRALIERPEAFLRVLIAALFYKSREALARGLVPAARLNIFSDVPWEVFCPDLFEFFSDVQFYDYTKVPGRKVPKNYDLTFSYSGEPEGDPPLARARRKNLEHELRVPRRIAVVFMAEPGLPRGAACRSASSACA